MAEGDEQLILSAAADEGGVVNEEERPEEERPDDLPLLWSSMDLPGMDSRD